MVNNLITNVTADGFTTRQGADIKTKTLIWTCGIRGTEFAKSSRSPTERSAASSSTNICRPPTMRMSTSLGRNVVP